jgi:hypothetical protein
MLLKKLKRLIKKVDKIESVSDEVDWGKKKILKM